MENEEEQAMQLAEELAELCNDKSVNVALNATQALIMSAMLELGMKGGAVETMRIYDMYIDNLLDMRSFIKGRCDELHKENND